jgi:Helix-turn-helix domain
MAEERIELSAKERERLKVLHQITQGHLRQIEAAHRLRLSDRQVRRLLQRLGDVGDRGLVHGLRGRPSNRKIPAEIEQRSLRRLRLPAYCGFGPTLAAVFFARLIVVECHQTFEVLDANIQFAEDSICDSCRACRDLCGQFTRAGWRAL